MVLIGTLRRGTYAAKRRPPKHIPKGELGDTPMSWINPWKASCATLGIACTGLGCYGAFTYATTLEGGISYLAIGAGLVPFAGAFAPPLIERLWSKGYRAQSVVWGVALTLAGALVILSAFERVHIAKASAVSERAALQSVASRAGGDLLAAKAALPELEKKEDWAKGRMSRKAPCGPECTEALEAAKRGRETIAQAEAKLTQAQAKIIEEPPYAAPAWLLPVTLELVGFVAIWSWLSSGTARTTEAPQVAATVSPSKVHERVHKAKRTRAANKLMRAARNDNTNVVPLRS